MIGADNGTMHCPRVTMRALSALLTASLISGVCNGCGPQPIIGKGWPDVYWRQGRYVLVAIDSEWQMTLALEASKGRQFIKVGNSVNAGDWLTLVRPTVFAVGANDRYIVAKQHPVDDDGRFDRAVTNYFVVDRATEEDTTRDDFLLGPLSKAEFDRLNRELGLPAFTKAFSSLDWQRTGD